MKNYYYEWLAIVPEVIEKYFTKYLNDPQLYETPLLPDVCFIEFDHGGRTYYAIIDKSGVSKVAGQKWGSRGDGYLNARGQYLHRVILNETRPTYYVHHKTAKFDNRAKNLQSVYYRDHSQKRSYCGVLEINESNVLQLKQLFQ